MTNYTESQKSKPGSEERGPHRKYMLITVLNCPLFDPGPWLERANQRQNSGEHGEHDCLKICVGHFNFLLIRIWYFVIFFF